MNSNTSKNRTCFIFFIIFIIIIIISGISIGVYFIIKKLINNNNNNKEDENKEDEHEYESFKITENHRKRISLLQECMKTYGIEELPILMEETYNNQKILNNKILSISTLEINNNKGETIQLFKNGLELQKDEYACISYESNKERNMIKVENGLFNILYDFSEEVNETPFTFILYFNYDPAINEYNSKKKFNAYKVDKSLDIYKKKEKNNNNVALRKLNFFSDIKDFFQDNIESIVEKAIEKTVSFACVSLIKYLFEEFYDIIIKGISQFACDELGELVGEQITNLIFKSNSQPEEKYKEIIYEESIKNNYKLYHKGIFSISYINKQLEKLNNEDYLEVQGDDYIKYASDIIPPEEELTKHNHNFSPLGNLILAELSSSYLKPILLRNKFDPNIHFFKQYKFEWKYTDEYNEEEDYIDLNTFLVDDKYILFNNLNCFTSERFINGETIYLDNEFYIAIQKIGNPIIKIYKNPKYIYLQKFSEFKAAFWIRNIEEISTCFKFNNYFYRSYRLVDVIDENWDILHYYPYAYKKINMAEYNISDIYTFEDFITFTSVEKIIMPFYTNENDCRIIRFISNNYRLNNINWNGFSIKAHYIKEFISYSHLEGIDLNMEFLKGVTDMDRFFEFDDLTNINITNFDTSQVTEFFCILANTMGDSIDFVKDWDTSKLNYFHLFISNQDIVKLDISRWNKRKIREMIYNMEDCTSLKYVDLSGYVKVYKDCNFRGLFTGSNAIEAVNVKGWDFSSTIFVEGQNFQCYDSSIFHDDILSSVLIYIDENMYGYLDTIKRFFRINNNAQFTIDPWPY